MRWGFFIDLSWLPIILPLSSSSLFISPFALFPPAIYPAVRHGGWLFLDARKTPSFQYRIPSRFSPQLGYISETLHAGFQAQFRFSIIPARRRTGAVNFYFNVRISTISLPRPDRLFSAIARRPPLRFLRWLNISRDRDGARKNTPGGPSRHRPL